MSTNLRVHIAPVGFDFRRVTEPLIQMRADKVYFLRYILDDADKDFIAAIKKELSNKLADIVIEEIRVDNWDFNGCIEQCRKIIAKEKKNGNHIYVNVSTGTRINSIAGMLACMIWDGTPYYARVTYPQQQVKKVPPSEHIDIQDSPPVYKIKKPERELMLILNLIKLRGGQMKKSELIRKLEDMELIKPRDETASRKKETWKHSQLRSWLDPLENEWHYVEVKASGRRSVVSITYEGETALIIFGTEDIA